MDPELIAFLETIVSENEALKAQVIDLDEKLNVLVDHILDMENRMPSRTLRDIQIDVAKAETKNNLTEIAVRDFLNQKSITEELVDEAEAAFVESASWVPKGEGIG